MFSRLSQIFFSYFTTRFEGLISATMIKVLEDFTKKSRQTLMLVIGSFILSALFTAGVIITILEASAQYDARGSIFFSALLTSSLILTILTFAGLAAIFWPRKTESAPIFTQPSRTPQSPFEEILATVVAEGVQAFQNRRETRRERTRPDSRNYSEA